MGFIPGEIKIDKISEVGYAFFLMKRPSSHCFNIQKQTKTAIVISSFFCLKNTIEQLNGITHDNPF